MKLDLEVMFFIPPASESAAKCSSVGCLLCAKRSVWGCRGNMPVICRWTLLKTWLHLNSSSMKIMNRSGDKTQSHFRFWLNTKNVDAALSVEPPTSNVYSVYLPRMCRLDKCFSMSPHKAVIESTVPLPGWNLHSYSWILGSTTGCGLLPITLA